MKTFILCIIMQGLLFSYLSAQDLQVISAGGNHATGNQGSLNYTIGECLVVPFEGATSTLTTGFHQGEGCPAQNVVGEIDGCALLCPGDLAHTYTYTVTPYPNLTDFEWTISPAGAATILTSTETSVELKFPNAGLTTANLRFSPRDICGDATPINLEITLDPACVWPGDINNDGIVDFDSDYGALNAAKMAYCGNVCNLDPDTIPGHPMRFPACLPIGDYDWEAYPAENWGSSFNFGTPSLNGKYGDADGNGEIENTPSNYNAPYLPLPPDPNDVDIIARYDYLGETHNGNSHKQNFMANNDELYIVPVDSVIHNGDTLKLSVYLGSPQNEITDLQSLAFKTTISEGPYGLHRISFDGSKFTTNPYIRSTASYFFPATDSSDFQWWQGIGAQAHQISFDFAGDKVCDFLICEVPVAGFSPDDILLYKTENLSADTTITTITIEGTYMVKGLQGAIGGQSTNLPQTSITVYVVNTPILHAKAYLGGPLVDSTYTNCDNTYLQNDDLRQLGLIPNQEPYSTLGYEYQGGGSESIDPSILDVTGCNAIVDWVILELRDKTDHTHLVHSRAALLQRDGDIVDLDGISPVKFREVPNDDYYLLLRHRNHLPVMSSTPVELKRGLENRHDFTVANSCYNDFAWQRLNSLRALFPADANTNCSIDGIDRVAWGSQSGSFNQYNLEDFNMDGDVNGADKNIWATCNGSYTNIPCNE